MFAKAVSKRLKSVSALLTNDIEDVYVLDSEGDAFEDADEVSVRSRTEIVTETECVGFFHL